MKTKTLSILFALVMVLSMSVGVFAQDFTETWDENTVLTIFSDVDMVFPDLFADIDSNFLWDNGPQPFPGKLPTTVNDKGETVPVAKAPLEGGEYQFDEDGNMIVDNNGRAVLAAYEPKFTFDPCGDGLIEFSVELTKMDFEQAPVANYYYGDPNVTYFTDIDAFMITGLGAEPIELGLKKCDSRGGEGCSSLSFRRNSDGTFTGKLKGYLTVPYGIVLQGNETVQMDIYFTDYFTSLWLLNNIPANMRLGQDSGVVTVTGQTVANTGRNHDYCQPSLQVFDGMGYAVRAKYDENTGEARLQAVVRNLQPNVKRQNYVIPAEVFAWSGDADTRITKYTCKYTSYNVANAAPRTDYCKFGEGIAIADHGMIRIDITIDHISSKVLRAADGDNIPFTLRLGGMTQPIYGEFEAVDFPCPPVSRMQVMDPLKPFVSSYPMLSDDAIEASGPYGVYEGGVWGLYQKCGKFAYIAVRLRNDGVREEVVKLDNVAVAINGGTPMSFHWVLSTIEPVKGNKIILDGGDDVILIGRAKVTDVPSQLNADTAMTGAVNFTDFGFYITGKIFSDHNNTNCVAAPK
jgi:hypothetical protein